MCRKKLQKKIIKKLQFPFDRVCVISKTNQFFLPLDCCVKYPPKDPFLLIMFARVCVCVQTFFLIIVYVKPTNKSVIWREWN